jgi:hypothetical protein
VSTTASLLASESRKSAVDTETAPRTVEVGTLPRRISTLALRNFISGCLVLQLLVQAACEAWIRSDIHFNERIPYALAWFLMLRMVMLFHPRWNSGFLRNANSKSAIWLTRLVIVALCGPVLTTLGYVCLEVFLPQFLTWPSPGSAVTYTFLIIAGTAWLLGNLGMIAFLIRHADLELFFLGMMSHLPKGRRNAS